MQAGIYFPKVRWMLLCFSPLILTHFWPASTLLRGKLVLAILFPPETDPQILEHWGYADVVHLGKSFRAKDFGLEFLRDVQQLLWILHVGLVSACLSSSVKSMKTSAAPCPERRNPIVVYWMGYTQQVRGARDVCHGKQRVSPFHRVSQLFHEKNVFRFPENVVLLFEVKQRVSPFDRTTHASSTWPLHFCHHSFWTFC